MYLPYRPLQSGEGERVGGWGPYVELARAVKYRVPLKQVWARGQGLESSLKQQDPAQETPVLSRVTDAQSRGEEWRRTGPSLEAGTHSLRLLVPPWPV